MLIYLVLGWLVLTLAWELRSERKARRAGGFADWITNPSFRASVSEFAAARDAVAAPVGLDDEGIRKLVSALLDSAIDPFAKRRLSLLGAPALPALIEALDDSRFVDDPKLATTVLSRPLWDVIDLIEEHSPPAAIPALSRLLEHQVANVVCCSSLALARIRTDACAAPLHAALERSDERTRLLTYIGMGLSRDSKDRPTPPVLSAMLFDSFQAEIDKEDDRVPDGAFDLLIGLDPPRALAHLTTPRFLNAEYGYLHKLIAPLVKHGVITPDHLHALVTDLRALPHEYPINYALREALQAFAQIGDSRAFSICQDLLDDPDEEVSSGAIDGMLELAGIPDPLSAAFDAECQTEDEENRQIWHRFIAVHILDTEVKNGGFAQFFSNCGERSAAALAGFRAIGDSDCADVVARAMALFGPNGPALDEDLRERQLARIYRKQSEVLDALDEEYFSRRKRLHVHAGLFALAHAELFRPSAASKAENREPIEPSGHSSSDIETLPAAVAPGANGDAIAADPAASAKSVEIADSSSGDKAAATDRDLAHLPRCHFCGAIDPDPYFQCAEWIVCPKCCDEHHELLKDSGVAARARWPGSRGTLVVIGILLVVFAGSSLQGMARLYTFWPVGGWLAGWIVWSITGKRGGPGWQVIAMLLTIPITFAAIYLQLLGALIERFDHFNVLLFARVTMAAMLHPFFTTDLLISVPSTAYVGLGLLIAATYNRRHAMTLIGPKRVRRTEPRLAQPSAETNSRR